MKFYKVIYFFLVLILSKIFLTQLALAGEEAEGQIYLNAFLNTQNKCFDIMYQAWDTKRILDGISSQDMSTCSYIHFVGTLAITQGCKMQFSEVLESGIPDDILSSCMD